VLFLEQCSEIGADSPEEEHALVRIMGETPAASFQHLPFERSRWEDVVAALFAMKKASELNRLFRSHRLFRSSFHEQPEGISVPRDAQRAVPSAEVASQARSILSLCSDKGSELAL